MSGDIERTIRQVIRRALGTTAGRFSATVDEDDVRSEVVLRLLRKLRALKAEPSPEPIQDFAAYTAGVTYHTCYSFLRHRYPAM